MVQRVDRRRIVLPSQGINAHDEDVIRPFRRADPKDYIAGGKIPQ
jgi:hypothetical protein